MKILGHALTSLLLAVPLLASAARAGGPGTPPAPPLMGWVFDEDAGTITIDPFSSLTGTLTGFTSAPWPAPGPFAYPDDNYLGFIGTSKVTVRDSGVVAMRDSASVSVWFRAPAVLEPRQHALYCERDMCEFNIYWVGIEKRPGFTPGVTFAIYDSTSPACGSGGWHVLTFPFIPADVEWHHVVGTLDPVDGMRLYFDGAPVASLPGIPPYRGGVQGTSTVGQAHVDGAPTGWIGSIDEVALFDHGLTASEVTWLYTHSISALPTPDFDTQCAGDGSGAACPCGNESAPGQGRGCKNSTNQGARLTAAGSARLSFDSLYLSVVEMPNNTSCLIFQGTSAAGGGLGTAFGDGLRCAGGSVQRLAVHVATSHYDWYPHAGEEPISVRGLIPGGGGERVYQVWYRNAASYCTSAVFNLSNGVRVVWGS